MLLLIQLRWIAVAGQILTIAFVQLVLGIKLPLAPMAAVIAGLIALNLASLAWLERAEVNNKGLLLGLLLDVAALTAQLCFSGGATNPFTFLYLVQVTLAVVLLGPRSTWVLVGVTCACFAVLTVYYQPLALPHPKMGDLFSLHILGTLICFAMDAALLVAFATRMTRNLRERDARLAAFKQHHAEQDHIVRMGLLASGAAHELGTPLASLAVILNDWRHMPELAQVPGISQEIQEMQSAVQRCKAILTGILLSAGEARGEAPRVTSVNALLDEIVREWRSSRAASTLQYDNGFGADLPIVSDSVLKQMVCNVLDNAFEASPGWVHLAITREGNLLVLKVHDVGPGFPPEMLEQLGKPYQSSKGRLGGGLGLFLVVNVIRKLGGSVSACNRAQGGATVTLSLPLTPLSIGARAHA
jgi:two-component system sensor histidine kinase RegB